MKHGGKFLQTFALTFFTPVITVFAAPYILEIHDTIGRSWEREPINWELSLKAGEFRGGEHGATAGDGSRGVHSVLPDRRGRCCERVGRQDDVTGNDDPVCDRAAGRDLTHVQVLAQAYRRHVRRPLGPAPARAAGSPGGWHRR